MAKHAICVSLIGKSRNITAIVNTVVATMKRYNVPLEEIELFKEETSYGDIDHVLFIVNKWVHPIL